MVAHDEAMALVGQLDQFEADRWLFGQVKTGFALFAQQVDDAGFGLFQGQVTEVEQLDLHLAVSVDHLQQLAAGVPQERGADRLVTLYHLLPGGIEQGVVDGFADGVTLLHEVDA
ncbi:hypothetical protein D3C78_556310 [compost metagenome]